MQVDRWPALGPNSSAAGNAISLSGRFQVLQECNLPSDGRLRLGLDMQRRSTERLEVIDDGKDSISFSFFTRTQWKKHKKLFWDIYILYITCISQGCLGKTFSPGEGKEHNPVSYIEKNPYQEPEAPECEVK